MTSGQTAARQSITPPMTASASTNPVNQVQPRRGRISGGDDGVRRNNRYAIRMKKAPNDRHPVTRTMRPEATKPSFASNHDANATSATPTTPKLQAMTSSVTRPRGAAGFERSSSGASFMVLVPATLARDLPAHLQRAPEHR